MAYNGPKFNSMDELNARFKPVDTSTSINNKDVVSTALNDIDKQTSNKGFWESTGEYFAKGGPVLGTGTIQDVVSGKDTERSVGLFGLIKSVGQAAGNVLGGAVAAVGTPIANAIKGKPLLENIGENIKSTAESTGDFMKTTTGTAVETAPIAVATALSGGMTAPIFIANISQSVPGLLEGISDIQKGDTINGSIKIGGAFISTITDIKSSKSLAPINMKASNNAIDFFAPKKQVGETINVRGQLVPKVEDVTKTAYDDLFNIYPIYNRARNGAPLKTVSDFKGLNNLVQSDAGDLTKTWINSFGPLVDINKDSLISDSLKGIKNSKGQLLNEKSIISLLDNEINTFKSNISELPDIGKQELAALKTIKENVNFIQNNKFDGQDAYNLLKQLNSIDISSIKNKNLSNFYYKLSANLKDKLYPEMDKLIYNASKDIIIPDGKNGIRAVNSNQFSYWRHLEESSLKINKDIEKIISNQNQIDAAIKSGMTSEETANYISRGLSKNPVAGPISLFSKVFPKKTLDQQFYDKVGSLIDTSTVQMKNEWIPTGKIPTSKAPITPEVSSKSVEVNNIKDAWLPEGNLRVEPDMTNPNFAQGNIEIPTKSALEIPKTDYYTNIYSKFTNKQLQSQYTTLQKQLATLVRKQKGREKLSDIEAILEQINTISELME